MSCPFPGKATLYSRTYTEPVYLVQCGQCPHISKSDAEHESHFIAFHRWPSPAGKWMNW